MDQIITSVGTMMAHFEAHVFHTSKDGIIVRFTYIGIHLSYVLQCDRAAVNLFTLIRD